MEHAEAPTPGLKWRTRKDGRRVPIWVAKPDAVKSGYPVKTVNLSGLEGAALSDRCRALEAEMVAWLNRPRTAAFDGSLGSLLRLYETHEDSTYQALKPASRAPYDTYLRKLGEWYGDKALAKTTGLDVKQWHREWRKPKTAGGKERVGAAAFALAVLKAALSFGIVSGIPDCDRIKAALSELRLPKPRPRALAPTAADVEKAREAAHELGRHRAALAFALQFETSARLWDVIGQWVALDDPRPSAVISGRRKWVGPTWANIDGSLVLSFSPSKTDQTTRARVHVPLSRCPMVTEELAKIPQDHRAGPLIFDEKTGLPYFHPTWINLWQKVRAKAELDPRLWSRDLRAGGITEAQMAGATPEDRAKMAGHSTKVNQEVYARDNVKASGRVVEARERFRKGK